MKYPVAVIAVKQADQCLLKQACQTDDDYQICKVAARFLEDTPVVHCKGRPDCNYRETGANIAVCRCPVRLEICRLHGV